MRKLRVYRELDGDAVTLQWHFDGERCAFGVTLQPSDSLESLRDDLDQLSRRISDYLESEAAQ